MHKLILALPILSFLMMACSNNMERNQARLDEIYGPCDNPHRQLSPVQKKICQDKVRAAGPDGEIGEPFSITDFINNRQSTSGSNDQVATYNRYLWEASLLLVKDYSLSVVDSGGGYIETDWIVQDKNKCKIKIQITSTELISTGVTPNLVCMKTNNGTSWSNVPRDQDAIKKMTLRILEIANAQKISS